MPWRVAFALQDDGWILRNEIIWSKPNAMPQSVNDRLSNRHEHMFMFSKSRNYWFDLDPIREPHVSEPGREGANYMRGQKSLRPVGPNSGQYSEGGRNPGDVWSIAIRPFHEAHFAVFPLALPERCILAGCKPGGTVLDPFSGSGTTGMAATRHGRKYVGIDLNRDYLDLSLRTRLSEPCLDFGDAA
jgi:site-specific DNA-methyltransferase (cytosine-N4-specific)